jgi:hypothetical protein
MLETEEKPSSFLCIKFKYFISSDASTPSRQRLSVAFGYSGMQVTATASAFFFKPFFGAKMWRIQCINNTHTYKCP